VELQKGSIGVESEPGKGSTFTVILTFDKHSFVNANLNSDDHKAHRKELTGMKILVAEDNQINAMILTRFLNKWKTEATVATDGQEAIDLLKKEKFDIVLMDLQMPNLDGMEATKLIRSSADNSINQIPIVALTADALVDTHRKLMQLGFNYCITKPFNPDALFNYLKKHYHAA
jgi:CheY-like chemotaxis protein